MTKQKHYKFPKKALPLFKFLIDSVGASTTRALPQGIEKLFAKLYDAPETRIIIASEGPKLVRAKVDRTYGLLIAQRTSDRLNLSGACLDHNVRERARLVNRIINQSTYVHPSLYADFEAGIPHICDIDSFGNFDYKGKTPIPVSIPPTAFVNGALRQMKVNLPPTDPSWGYILVGVAERRLNFTSYRHFTDSLRALSEVDVVFYDPTKPIQDLEFPVSRPHFDTLYSQILIRDKADPAELYCFIPVAVSLDHFAQFGVNYPNRFYLKFGKYMTPHSVVHQIFKKGYRARILGASCNITGASSQNIMEFSGRVFDNPDAALVFSELFNVPTPGDVDLTYLKQNYFRVISGRYRRLESYFNLTEFSILKNATVRFFQMRKLSYKTAVCKPAFAKNRYNVLNHTFPITNIPVFDITENFEDIMIYFDKFMDLWEQSMTTEKELKEEIAAETKEIERLQTEDTAAGDLYDILHNDPVAIAIREAEAKDAELNNTLSQLGLSDVEDKRSPHVKIKKLHTDLTKSIKKLNVAFTKANEALKQKSRPYIPGQPLSNKNPYYTELTDPVQITLFFDEILQAGICGYDIETTGLHPLRGEQVLTHQFSYQPYVAIMIRQALLDEHPLLFDRYRFLMESPSVVKVIHNVKFKYTFTSACLGVDIVNYFDTMVAAQMLDENSPNGLKFLASKELNVDMIEFSEVTYGTKKYDPDAKYAVEYACADADLALQLYLKFRPMIDAGGTPHELTKSGGSSFTRLFYEISMPIAKLLGKMELAGIVLNMGLLNAMKRQVDRDYLRMQKEIHTAAPELNPDSSRQLAKFLYEELKLPILSYTSGGKKGAAAGVGQPSTDMKTIRKLVKMFPEIQILTTLIEYSKLSQFKSLYLDSFPKHFNPNTCAIHTQIHQTRTVTSRFSSSDPNLQNLRRNQED